MPEPIRPAGPTPQPATIELEPVIITAPGVAPSVPLPVWDIAVECFGEALNVGLTGATIASAASKVHPALAALTLFESGLELGECIGETIDDAQQDASIRQAIEQCVEDGGTPIAGGKHTLFCAVPEGTL